MFCLVSNILFNSKILCDDDFTTYSPRIITSFSLRKIVQADVYDWVNGFTFNWGLLPDLHQIMLKF